MLRSLSAMFVVLGLLFAVPQAQAQVQTKAYAPENLRTLSYNDQVRVISLEYSEQSRGRRIADDQLRFYIDQINRSNWGFSRIKADIAQSLGNSGGPSYGGDTIRCDSNGNDARRCPTPWRGPSRMVRQVSKNACVEGRSWSSQDGQITVWKGCRAEFAAAVQVLPPRPTPVGSVRCESTNKQPRTCRVPWSGPSRLSRQLSSTECREGFSWRSQQGQVYVGQGCRAEFSPAAQVLPPRPTPGGYSVTCASVDNRSVTCPWPPGYGTPRLLQQLSTSPCIQGQTWGLGSRSEIWVSRGCRGRFGN